MWHGGGAGSPERNDTALSGGGLWMPTNPLMATFGQEDSVDNALTYMAAAIGDAGPASSQERRRAFVERAGGRLRLPSRPARRGTSRRWTR